jgi:hypothetical protein
MKQVYTLALPLLVLIALQSTAQINGGLPAIAITEIMFNPPESGIDSLEYLEVHNYGSTPVNMAGYTFTGIDLIVPAEVMGLPPIIAAGEYFILAINATALTNTLSLSYAFEWTGGALSNNGEGVSLRDPNGNLIDTVYFDDTVAWPAETSGGGASLERCEPTSDGTLPSSWIASTTTTGAIVNGVEIFGTPGEVNSTCVAVGIDDPIITTLSAYPNPSSNGKFYLSSEITGIVYDAIGQEIMIIRNSNVVDLSEKSAGQYILRSDNGQVVRLVK